MSVKHLCIAYYMRSSLKMYKRVQYNVKRSFFSIMQADALDIHNVRGYLLPLHHCLRTYAQLIFSLYLFSLMVCNSWINGMERMENGTKLMEERWWKMDQNRTKINWKWNKIKENYQLSSKWSEIFGTRNTLNCKWRLFKENETIRIELDRFELKEMNRKWNKTNWMCGKWNELKRIKDKIKRNQIFGK